VASLDSHEEKDSVMTSKLHPALRRLMDDPTGTHVYIVLTYCEQRQLFQYLSSQVSPLRNSPDIRFYSNGNRVKTAAGGQLIIYPESGDINRLRGLDIASIDKDDVVRLVDDALHDFWHVTKARIRHAKTA